MLMRVCDICKREIRKTEGRYKLVFIGRLYDTNKDVCADCIKRISDEIKQADTPQTEMDKCYKCKWWNYSYGCSNKKGICDFEPKADAPQTESTGSPIGDYRDGVGAWQTEKTPAGCSKSWSAACTYWERYFSCDYLSGRQTDCGWK